MPDESDLVAHAKRELELAGLHEPDSDYGGMLYKAVLELIEVFSRQGHSGASASITIELFKRLASYKPLTPLEDKPEDWIEVAEGLYQHRRCSEIFKQDGEAYWAQGRIFKDSDGGLYVTEKSSVPIAFPFTMREPEIVPMREESK